MTNTKRQYETITKTATFSSKNMTYASAADDGLIARQQVQRPPRHPPSTLDARQAQRSTEENSSLVSNQLHPYSAYSSPVACPRRITLVPSL